jgi:hypothetical protein
MLLEAQDIVGITATTVEKNLFGTGIYFQTDGLRTIVVNMTETGGVAASVKAYDSPTGATDNSDRVQIGATQAVAASTSYRFVVDNPGRYFCITATTTAATCTLKYWITGKD